MSSARDRVTAFPSNALTETDMASKITLYGDYTEKIPRSDFQVLHLNTPTLSTDQLWENGSLSATYMSHFWESFFPGYKQTARADIRDSIRYVASELIGNAVKYGAESDIIVKIALDSKKREFRVVLTNSLNPSEAEGYRTYIERLLGNDPEALYIDQMERNAAKGGWQSSIGILTIMLDYGGNLAWKFEADNKSGKQTATTLVRMPISETHLG